METSLDVDQVCELVKRQADVVLLDVREQDEFSQVAIDGSMHVPLGKLVEELPKLDLVKDKQIICICRSGRRSSLAAEFLRAQGYQAVNMEGGMRDWTKHRHAEGLIDDKEYARVSTFLGKN